ncbi:MAG: dephospho-CoA kinase [Clostridiales bacterium]|nr:dephospho-CoA kinase [Clostridiales bacterium]
MSGQWARVGAIINRPHSSGQYIIGVTGGIGAGKSTVAAMLGELGAVVLSADEISRRALDVGTPCYEEVLAWLGDEILLPDGAINRRAVAALVFADEKKRERLNAIIHPWVLRELQTRTNEIAGLPPHQVCGLGGDPDARNDANKETRNDVTVVWDVPLLFESGWAKFVDHTLLVTAPVEVRLQRLALPRGEALARMAAQWTDEEKAALADAVLENDGTLAKLRQAVESLYGILTVESLSVVRMRNR